MSATAYDVVTDRILGLLERGTIPWRQPWRANVGDGVANLVSGRIYSGLNALTLPALGYGSRWFLTYRQAASLGGHVRKGEKAFPVTFWRFDEREDRETGKRETVPFLRYFSVFNLEQCDIPEDALPKRAREVAPERTDFERIAECERIAAGYAAPRGPEVVHRGARACYAPGLDLVAMPAPEAFTAPAGYYSTLFHELTHSTGHESRLARKVRNGFGSKDYGREELVAEMGAAFLCQRAGISPETVEQSAAYCASWIKTIRTDPRACVVAAGAAAKAAAYILDEKRETEEESE